MILSKKQWLSHFIFYAIFNLFNFGFVGFGTKLFLTWQVLYFHAVIVFFLSETILLDSLSALCDTLFDYTGGQIIPLETQRIGYIIWKLCLFTFVSLGVAAHKYCHALLNEKANFFPRVSFKYFQLSKLEYFTTKKSKIKGLSNDILCVS